MNIAVSIIVDAYEDKFDRALLVSRDSDLAPAVRQITTRFAEKRIVVLAPPGLRHSGELVHALPQKSRGRFLKTIKDVHLDRSLLPREVVDDQGRTSAVRPPKYDPPENTRPTPPAEQSS